jgi:ZIP family zinc transporter
MFNTHDILFALALTIFAGLATGVGSIMAFFSKKFNPKFLCVSLGFSAGVMIYVSLIEIFVKAKDSLSSVYPGKSGYWMTLAGFFVGIAVIAIIDKLIPEGENPHEISNMEHAHAGDGKLMRTGSSPLSRSRSIISRKDWQRSWAGLVEPSLGISIAVAIAIHNIPEGISVSVPIYYATKTEGRPSYSFLSGLAEPSAP